MEDQGALKADGVQQRQIAFVVQQAGAGGLVAGIAVPLQVLGVGQGDIGAEQFEGLVEDCCHSRQRAGVEEVGRVDYHLEVRGAHLVEQAAGLAGRIHDVGYFGFKDQGDVVVGGDLHGGGHGLEHFSPGRRRAVFGVVAPHVVGVARAGGKGDQRGAEMGAGSGQGAQTLKAALPLLDVGMDDVEGAG